VPDVQVVLTDEDTALDSSSGVAIGLIAACATQVSVFRGFDAGPYLGLPRLRRCRTASNKTTAAAAETFKLLT
jgi:hypothetical protein